MALLALLGWLVFEPIPDLFAPTEGLSPEAQAKARNDVRTTALQLLGGTVLALGAYFTWQNVLTNREGRRIELQGQITERFTRAIDQLGNEKLDVRLGGIYGLERIARDSREDHGPVMAVLTRLRVGACFPGHLVQKSRCPLRRRYRRPTRLELRRTAATLGRPPSELVVTLS